MRNDAIGNSCLSPIYPIYSAWQAQSATWAWTASTDADGQYTFYEQGQLMGYGEIRRAMKDDEWRVAA